MTPDLPFIAQLKHDASTIFYYKPLGQQVDAEAVYDALCAFCAKLCAIGLMFANAG